MSKKVLLIADDDNMSRTIIKKFLSDKYEVIEAVDGNETIDAINSIDVDVVLLDIIMPEKDGFEVLEYMRNHDKFKDMGVLVATSAKEKTERTALSLGADDVVAKPFDPVIINKRLENIIASKEIQKQKKLLQSSDIDELIHSNLSIYLSSISDPIKNLRKIADVIKKNPDNELLVKQLSTDILKETDAIEKIFVEE